MKNLTYHVLDYALCLHLKEAGVQQQSLFHWVASEPQKLPADEPPTLHTSAWLFSELCNLVDTKITIVNNNDGQHNPAYQNWMILPQQANKSFEANSIIDVLGFVILYQIQHTPNRIAVINTTLTKMARNYGK